METTRISCKQSVISNHFGTHRRSSHLADLCAMMVNKLGSCKKDLIICGIVGVICKWYKVNVLKMKSSKIKSIGLELAIALLSLSDSSFSWRLIGSARFAILESVMRNT